jgi:hypothetical protein
MRDDGWTWLLLGSVTFACGGSAFTGADPDSAGTGGVAGRATAGTTGDAGRGGKGPGGGSSGSSTTAGGGSASMTGGTPALGGAPGAAGSITVPGPDTSCPASPPAAGRACKDGLRCSYGSDVRLQCRSSAICEGGTWKLNEPDCAALEPCGTTVIAGGPCDDAQAECVKDDAEYCACTACLDMICSSESTWRCSSGSGSMGCPPLAPNQGSACKGQRTCDYGSCSFGQASPGQATCYEDVWSYEMVTCPP